VETDRVKGAQQAAFKKKKGVEQPIAGQHVGNPDRIGKYQFFFDNASEYQIEA
jgi:hypothetical protein